ncbi:MAG TPA: hypothetical protein VNS88_00705 [Nitrospiraceae bacterium]|nr:hypothetical protein [Nitrospiraceae bacterium]
MDKKELAQEALELKNNSIFKHAVQELRKQWFEEMMVLEPGNPQYTLTCTVRCAMLQALEAIPTELQRIINNYKMDPNRGG